MTALNKQALHEAAQEEIMLRSVSDTSDAWQDEASPEAVLALLDELEAKDSMIAAQQHEIRTLLNALEGRPCPKCNDTGMADSGGTQPWGEPISVPCDCAAPPAPVSVPAAMEMDDDFDSAFEHGKAVGWNACRAAMLQGAEPVKTANKLPFEQWLSQQTGTIDVECGCVMTEVFFHWLRVAYETGNSPVIPDGWIPVSERIPERDVDVQVYCADKKEQMVGYMERNETEGWFRFASLPNGGGVYCKPTHWMELPAAPQQEDL
ncbi:DUF551 domain-containing protein [Citrobacter portucalensis]|uniref:DUF551 domain-containing protein n=1 Tax=Citrobacter portucalensis TaxID=1639133 RepID=A0ABZ0H841_9ENTR|nr:DUF551 domain-containing protein [Citrobacter portucalensis]